MNYKLETVVKEYLAENGDQNMNRFYRVLPIAVSGLRELNMDVNGIPKVVHLELSDSNTVGLPDDYIKYTRIGVCDSNGNIIDLSPNPNICLNHNTDDCGNIVGNNNQSADYGFIGSFDGPSDNWRNGEMMGRFFGVGGGGNPYGYYKIDELNGVIQFSGVSGHIVLEYIAEISSVDGNFLIHPFIIETIKAWISWKLALNNPSAPIGRTQVLEKRYWQTYRIARKRVTSATVKEWLTAFRIFNTAAPKF